MTGAVPVNGRLPDFFIVGAMRAGTTSLHHILESHRDVFIPRQEIFFFDADDFEEHAEQSRRPNGTWWFRNFEEELEAALPSYRATFASAGPGQCIGEDSTTYLTAAHAPARIAALIPEAKILVSLRDPVARVWSHYWHLVSSGRAVLDFESALLSARGTLLKRSTYTPALQRWLARFPREQIHVVIFEDFIRDPQAYIDGICAFLGLSGSIDYAVLPAEVRHRHRARGPGVPRLVLAANWLRRQARHQPQLIGPVPAPVRHRRDPLHVSLIKRLARRSHAERYPPMHPETRAFLELMLGRANADLPALLGRPLDDLWPCMRSG